MKIGEGVFTITYRRISDGTVGKRTVIWRSEFVGLVKYYSGSDYYTLLSTKVCHD